MGVQRMNKKGLGFKESMFSLVVISMISISLTIMLSGWSNNYGTSVSSDLDDFNRLDTLSSESNIQKGKLSTNDPDPGSDFEGNTFRGVYGILARMFSVFGIYTGEDGFIASTSERFGIADYVQIGLITMAIIAIAFALVAIIFRLSRESA